MPKLSKTRIINLNYNDGKRTIYNELFDYGTGKDTLFSMENGIGKTVLIQFLMQPFLRNKRELQGRRFADYFTAGAPTYIMHEVLLDNGEKLLVGMLIKKDHAEDEKNKLRILAFLHKYSKPNDFDIINAPLVEDKKILGFSECEEKIKKYKSGRLNFKYYNFNDSSKKAEYFEDLKAYKIDYKEWEDIIRSINNDESGLSNLYDKHKTDEALLRNVIIPLIESKINGEKNAIEAIRNNLGKYIESYKQSKESFYEVELLKGFAGDMVPITQLLQEGTLKENTREALNKRLAHIALLAEEELTRKSTEKLRHEELMAELNYELTRVAYEEHSLNYYTLQTQEDKVSARLEEVQEDHHQKELKKQELVKEKYIQECAEIYEELLFIESSLIETRERIANYHRDDSEVAQSIRNYRFTLKNLYDLELKELEGAEKELLNNQAQAKAELEKNKQELEANDRQQKEAIREEAALLSRIRSFEKTEAQFKKKHADFTVLKNVLLNEYDEKELERYSLSIDDSIEAARTLHETLTNEAALLKAEKATLSEKITSAGSNLTAKKLELGAMQKDLELFQQETAKVLEILAIKNLPLDPVSQRDKLQELLNSENIKLQEVLNKEQDKLREIQDTVHRYETGLIQLPKEVVQSFADKGIEFEYALSWLQNLQETKEEKERLINNNPFFPYGILLSAKDINLLKSENLDVYTSIPIPIINKSELNKGVAIDKHNDVLTIANQEFLLAFNSLLVDEAERNELLRALRLDMELAKAEIAKLQQSVERNKNYERIVAAYPYDGDEDQALKAGIAKLERENKELEQLLAQYRESVQHKESRREAITKELGELDKTHIFLEEKRDKFNSFIIEHQEFQQNSQELFALQKRIEELKVEARKLNEANSELGNDLSRLNLEVYELKKNIGNCADKLELYKNAEPGILLQEDKAGLEAKLVACEKKLDDNIKRDQADEKRLTKDLSKAQNKLRRTAGEGSITNEYIGVVFAEDRWAELKAQIHVLEQQTEKLKQEIHNLDKEVEIIATKKQREQEDINKLGFELPIAKEQIKDPDFQTRKKKIQEDLRQNAEIIKDYQEQINKLNTLRQQLIPFKSYSANDEVLDFSFKDLPVALKVIEQDLDAYDSIKKEIYTIENKLTHEIRQIYEKYRDKNKFIQDRLNNYLGKERKVSSHSDLESLLEIVGRKISTLELELKSIKLEEEVVLNEILRYAVNVLQELKTIDKKSSIKHLGRTQKLLEISIPEEKEEESLKEYIKEKVNYYANFEGDYNNHLENDIQSAQLLSKVIGNINRIRVDIKKIEKTGLVRKSWQEALSQNSGGEKFVSMFILLSSLMSYMRRRETDLDNREENKILIMDNPFAKTNADHLLEPMFQIAEKYNIQLLCFSGIGGSAVYNRFDKIYVAKVIADRFRNKENVSFKAGNEETLELSDFTITKEQISMF